jgi:heme/copper-type cytochrome/quinol oxidase subunit 2
MKKSQLKIGESIAVLFIFFVLVVMGVIFWSKYSQSSVAQRIEEDALSKSIKISQIVSYIPELQCSTQEVIKFNCFDTLKIEKMSDIMSNSDAKLYYFDTLSFSNITVVSIYPDSESFNVYDRPYFVNGTHSYRVTQVPIAVYNPETGKYGFGYIDVRVYITTQA